MNHFRHYPLGQTVPDTVHAVCCSLPTMADVRAYEEGDPQALAAIQSAYPRFVVHHYIRKVADHVAESLGLHGRAIALTSSAKGALKLTDWLAGADPVTFELDGCHGVHHIDRSDHRDRVKAFLQHTGHGMSSRVAEAYLVSHGLLAEPQIEVRLKHQPQAVIRDMLQPYLDTPHWHLSVSGMNAFCTAIDAIRAVQRPKGRTGYVQLGWLYLDTQRVLAKLLQADESVHVIYDVHDKAAVEALFAEHGDTLAGVITELPTNPLVHFADVQWLSELCQRHGCLRLFDPSLAGLANMEVLPHCDLLVTSLTKYAASAGDVLCGALAVNPASSEADALAAHVASEVVAPALPDTERLAAQITAMPEVVRIGNANAQALAQWLEAHPAIRRVYYAGSNAQASGFAQVARHDQAVGAILTFELNGPVAEFYDRAPIVKGPSFGTTFTMMCPFLYLAHYDLVSSPSGRAFLQKHGLDPELIRLSVGTEPLADIQAALETGLTGA